MYLFYRTPSLTVVGYGGGGWGGGRARGGRRVESGDAAASRSRGSVVPSRQTAQETARRRWKEDAEEDLEGEEQLRPVAVCSENCVPQRSAPT